MRSLFIAPGPNRVIELETDGNPDNIKKLLDCDALRFVALDEANALLVDAGGLQKPDQDFWKLATRPQVFGGAGLLVGLDGEGMITDTDEAPDTIGVDWLRVKYTGMRQVAQEEIDTAWGPGIAVTYVPGFEPLPEPEPAPEPEPDPHEYAFWTIVRIPDGFAAHRMLATRQGTRQTDIVLENEDLVTLRGLLPLGLQRVERTVADHPDLLETWLPS